MTAASATSRCSEKSGRIRKHVSLYHPTQLPFWLHRLWKAVVEDSGIRQWENRVVVEWWRMVEGGIGEQR